MSTIRLHAAAAVAALLLSVAASPAGAVGSSDFTYSSAKTDNLILTPLAFYPGGQATADQEWQVSQTTEGLSGTGCFNTGIYLPDGAKITKLRYIFQKGITIRLVSSNQQTGAVTYPVNQTKIGSVTQRTGTTVTLSTPAVVDNANAALGMVVCMSDAAARFYGARITYTYTSAGD